MKIIIVLIILATMMVLLTTEWVPLEVIALLVLGTLAVTGLVSPTDALSGFSNPAVVTIWAVFMLSGGLTRTGIANILGRKLLKVAVAALMLPVVMDIARKTGHSPSVLLMPLAYGSLLGGLMTMIGTPPTFLSARPCAITV